MKKLIISVFVFVLFAACKKETVPTLADEYVVNKTTTACNCTVQKTVERPQIGKKHLGPYKTKQEAIDAMCKDIDPDMENQNKCWTVTPISICNSGKPLTTRQQPLNKFDYFVQVRALKQPKNMDCWATALTMLYSWKNNDNTIAIRDVLKKYGDFYVDLFDKNKGIQAAQEDQLYKIIKLNVIVGQNPSIKMWYDLLKAHGPLSITIDSKPPYRTYHSLVVNGIKSGGKPENTSVDYIDPANGKQYNDIPFADFVTLYEAGVDYAIQIISYP